MKLIHCLKCGSIYALNSTVNVCTCGETFGKYLSDRMTGAVRKSKYCLIFGIDNGSFASAVRNYITEITNFDDGERRDWFFTGWVCTHPGEVVLVDTIEELYELDESKIVHATSTPPSTETFQRALVNG